LKLAADGGKKLKAAFDGVSGAFAALSKGKKALSDLSGGFSSAETAASDASGAWGSMGGKLSTVLQKLGLMKAAQAEATVATEGETAAQGELDVAMDANPIGLIIVAVAALAAGIYELAKHSAAFRDFWKAAWKDIQAVAMAVFHVLEPALKVYADLWKVEWDIVKTVSLAAFRILEDAAKLWVKQWVVEFDLARDAVKFAFSLITDYIRINVDVIKAVLSWFGRLPGLFLGWFMDAANAVNTGTQRILSFVRSLPGKIISALSSLGSMMFNAGAHAIEELIGGITSRIGSLGSTMSGVASKIAGFIGLSPAKEGPLSGGGAPFIRGSHITADMAAGMMSRTSAVGAAARKMAAAVAGGTAGGGAGAGAGAQRLDVYWHFEPTGNEVTDALGRNLKGYVRRTGGSGPNSAQIAFGNTR
jgi:phage-related protein